VSPSEPMSTVHIKRGTGTMRSYMGRSIALHGKSSRRRSKTTSLPSSHPGVNVIDEELSSGSVGGPIGPQRNSADPNNDDCKAACRLVHTGASTSVRTTHQSIEHLFEVGSSTVEHVTIGATQPGRVPSILRALRRRCPVCGSKEISRHPVQVYDRCPTCDLDLERQVGSFIGGIGLNTIFAFVVLFSVIIVGFIATGGEASVTRILLPALAVSVLLPLFFYARSRLLWVALELIWWPLDADETLLVN